MAYTVEYTDEFGAVWAGWSESQQEDIAAMVGLLEERGPHLRELRVQSGGRPLRIFYAFDPRRAAILLIGGDKTGDDRFFPSDDSGSRCAVRHASGRTEA